MIMTRVEMKAFFFGNFLQNAPKHTVVIFTYSHTHEHRHMGTHTWPADGKGAHQICAKSTVRTFISHTKNKQLELTRIVMSLIPMANHVAMPTDRWPTSFLLALFRFKSHFALCGNQFGNKSWVCFSKTGFFFKPFFFVVIDLAMDFVMAYYTGG